MAEQKQKLSAPRKQRISAPPILEELRLDELMAKAGLKSLQELADKMGIERASLSRSLNSSPTYAMLYNLADALGVKVQDLFRNGNSEQQHDMRGVLYFDGTTYLINDYDDLLKAGEEIRKAYI